MQPRILREVDAMRRIHHHPNILKIHEVLATKTKIYLIVELAAGGELFNKITRKGKLTEPIARKYFQQLVSALCFCHKNGVIHRDLKPQNLLLDHDGNLKVSDFGLSALPEQLKNGLLHTACGTPAYTAPEVLFRRGYDGSKADAWSCGLILFVLLAGYLPFSDANIPEMCRKISRRDYKFPEWISKPARFVIHRLLDPNPNNRMSLECLYQNSWFKKSIKARPNESLFGPDQAQPDERLFGPGQAWPSGGLSGPGQPDEGCGRIERMGSGVNAFDIISMSSGLDLTGLFETASDCRREKRFMSKASIVVVEEKVKEVGGILGFKVEIGKDGVIGLGKGKVVIVVEVFEIVADELLMVSVKVMNGGFEFDELHWGDWKSGLQDVVLSWHNESV